MKNGTEINQIVEECRQYQITYYPASTAPYGIHSETKRVKYEVFVKSLLERQDINELSLQLLRESEENSGGKLITSSVLTSIFNQLYGEPVQWNPNKVPDADKLLVQLFSPNFMLMTMGHIENGQVSFPRSIQNKGGTTGGCLVNILIPFVVAAFIHFLI